MVLPYETGSLWRIKAIRIQTLPPTWHLPWSPADSPFHPTELHTEGETEKKQWLFTKWIRSWVKQSQFIWIIAYGFFVPPCCPSVKNKTKKQHKRALLDTPMVDKGCPYSGQSWKHHNLLHVDDPPYSWCHFFNPAPQTPVHHCLLVLYICGWRLGRLGISCISYDQFAYLEVSWGLKHIVQVLPMCLC